MKWYSLVFVSIVIEGIITYAKTVVVEKQVQWQVVGSMLLGVGCALAFDVDLFAIAGITAAVPYVGQVLTGVLLSRGSNYVYDLLKQLTNAKTEVASLELAADETEVENHEDGGEG